METIKIYLKIQQQINLQVMCRLISEDMLTYTKNFTGFLDWQNVISSSVKRKFAFSDEVATDRDLEFDVYEIESMIYMIKWLGQTRNNEFLMLKLIDAISTFIILPSGKNHGINEWYDNQKFLKEKICDNREFSELDVYELEYLKERFACNNNF